MSLTTTFLSLVLPQNGEYVDTWDDPLNANLQKIDLWAFGVNQEIVDARFGESSLKNFLLQSFNNDGTLKPTEEVLNSRSSLLYGDQSPAGVDFDLATRLFQSDKEVFYAREGSSDLRQALAVRSSKASKVLEGSKDSNGLPVWMGSTGTNINLDGATQNILFLISGKVGRVRKLEQIPVSGSVGTKQVYAQFNPEGLVRVNGDTNNPPPTTASGSTGSDGAKVTIFSDLTVDFTTKDVKPGDILEIIGNGANAGLYQIGVVAPGGNVNQLKILGVFPGGSSASLNYTVRDPFAVTLGVDDTLTPADGKFYIGEADYDGTGITAVRAIHFDDFFIGDWRSVDVSTAPTFTEVWNHKLFDDALDIEIQVSQANDGSAPIEILSNSGIFSSLGITNTLALTAGDQTLSGGVNLTGSLINTRSAKMQFTKTQVTVQNFTANLFYKDYSSTDRQSGYVRVVVKKLRK